LHTGSYFQALQFRPVPPIHPCPLSSLPPTFPGPSAHLGSSPAMTSLVRWSTYGHVTSAAISGPETGVRNFKIASKFKSSMWCYLMPVCLLSTNQNDYK